MNKIPYILATLVLSAAISCSRSEDMNDQIFLEQTPVGFSTYVTGDTKGQILGSGDDYEYNIENTGFGVFGYYTNQDKWSDDFIPNFMFNQFVEYDTSSSSWVYTPLKYWSNVLYDKYSFFAYAPYGGDGITTKTSYSDTGAPQFDFAINSDASEMVDFVTSYDIDVEHLSYMEEWDMYYKSQSTITLSMVHQLSRLSFTAKTDMHTEGSYIVVKSMKFLAEYSPGLYTSGVYSYDISSESNSCGKWSDLVAATSDYSFDSILNSDGSGIKVTSTETQLFKNGEYLFLLPPNGTEGVDSTNSCRVEMTIDLYDSDGKRSGSDLTASFMLEDEALRQGVANNYEITYTDKASEVFSMASDTTLQNVSLDGAIDINVVKVVGEGWITE